jgi:hypothetical protein
MALNPRPALLRPLEHIALTTDIVVNLTGYQVPTGVYANVLALAQACVGNVAEWTKVKLTDDFKISFYDVGANLPSWSNTTLAAQLGFDGLESYASGWLTASASPASLWVAEYQKRDQGCFGRPTNSYFAGNKSITGNLSGISYGNVAYSRKLSLQAELSPKLGIEFCTTALQEAACLDTFVMQALTSIPALATNPSTRGFWYYPDVNKVQEHAEETDDYTLWTTNGTINGAYVFCHFDDYATSDWRNSAFFTTSHLRYNVDLFFTTATAPSFSLGLLPPPA